LNPPVCKDNHHVICFDFSPPNQTLFRHQICQNGPYIFSYFSADHVPYPKEFPGTSARMQVVRVSESNEPD
jgi:hypothetical protein